MFIYECFHNIEYNGDFVRAKIFHDEQILKDSQLFSKIKREKPEKIRTNYKLDELKKKMQVIQGEILAWEAYQFAINHSNKGGIFFRGIYTKWTIPIWATDDMLQVFGQCDFLSVDSTYKTSVKIGNSIPYKCNFTIFAGMYINASSQIISNNIMISLTKKKK